MCPCTSLTPTTSRMIWRADLVPGSLVRVEFGVAMQPAVILAFHAKTDIPETKPLIELLDPNPVLAKEYLELAKWLSDSCLAPVGACVWLMLPPGFTGKSDRLFRFLRDELQVDQPQQLILPGADPEAELPLPRRLIDYLRDKGPKRLRQLKSAFPKQSIEPELDRLVQTPACSLPNPYSRHRLRERRPSPASMPATRLMKFPRLSGASESQ